jgi:Doubled CXXCH motif (Paired_CXXCH_1)
MRGACWVGTLLALGRVSAEPCRVCHEREATAHTASAHAHALQPVLRSGFYQWLPNRPIGEARDGFLLTYQLQSDSVQVTAEKDGEMATALIQWIFGAGRRAETPVARRGSVFLEHRISYYSAGNRFDLTMGHSAGISRSAEQALGRAQPKDVIDECFRCHSTGGIPPAESFQAGVQCESCHAGALEHSNHHGQVQNPGRLKPKALVAFCASCHRSQPEGNPEDLINVRYQVVRLSRSKCFQTGKLSCLTCHDAHADVQKDSANYRTRCLACHPDQQDRGDCVPCHMTRVSVTSRLVFTDHYIRVK